MKTFTFCFLLCLLLLVLSCTDKSTGTVDGTDTGSIEANLYTIDGKPAKNAPVMIFKSGDNSGIYIDSVNTDENGCYKFIVSETGKYCIWAENDTSAYYNNTYINTMNDIVSRNDTLVAKKTYYIPVLLEPQHNPLSIETQVLGTHKHFNVNKSSLLSLVDFPYGNYSLRSVCTIEGYTPTNSDISITPNSPDTLLDTIKMIYSDVPVVRNIKAYFDTLSNTTKISWDRSTFFKLRDYLVYRDYADVLNPSKEPIGYSNDTLFIDSLGDKNFEKGKIRYRVAIRDSALNCGPTYYSYDIDYVPLSFLKIFTKIIDTINLHFPFSFDSIITPPVWLGEIDSVVWSIDESTFTTKKMSLNYLNLKNLGKKSICNIQVYSKNGRSLKDSLPLIMASKWIENVPNPIGDSGIIGSIVNHNNSVYLTNERDSVVQIWKSDNGLNWEKINLAISINSENISYPISNIESYNGELYILSYNDELWRSKDGILWEKKLLNFDIMPSPKKMSAEIQKLNDTLEFFVQYDNGDNNTYSKRLNYFRMINNELGSHQIILRNSIHEYYGSFIFQDKIYCNFSEGAGIFGLFNINNEKVTNLEFYEIMNNFDLAQSIGTNIVEYLNGVYIVNQNDEMTPYFIQDSISADIFNYNGTNSLKPVSANKVYGKCFKLNNRLFIINKNMIYSDHPLN